MSRARFPRPCIRTGGPADVPSAWTPRSPVRMRTASIPRMKLLAWSFAASSWNNNPSGTCSRPRGERFCWRRLADHPSARSTGQIKSSSVWLSLGDAAAGNRTNRARNLVWTSSSAASVTVSQSGNVLMEPSRKSSANRLPWNGRAPLTRRRSRLRAGQTGYSRGRSHRP